MTRGCAMDNHEFCGNGSDGQSGKASEPKKRKLLDRMMDALLAVGFDQQSALGHVHWARDVILFHGKRHPHEMGPAEICAYLGSDQFASPSGRADRVKAEDALKFLYEEVT